MRVVDCKIHATKSTIEQEQRIHESSAPSSKSMRLSLHFNSLISLAYKFWISGNLRRDEGYLSIELWLPRAPSSLNWTKQRRVKTTNQTGGPALFRVLSRPKVCTSQAALTELGSYISVLWEQIPFSYQSTAGKSDNSHAPRNHDIYRMLVGNASVRQNFHADQLSCTTLLPSQLEALTQNARRNPNSPQGRLGKACVGAAWSAQPMAP